MPLLFDVGEDEGLFIGGWRTSGGYEEYLVNDVDWFHEKVRRYALSGRNILWSATKDSSFNPYEIYPLQILGRRIRTLASGRGIQQTFFFFHNKSYGSFQPFSHYCVEICICAGPVLQLDAKNALFGAVMMQITTLQPPYMQNRQYFPICTSRNPYHHAQSLTLPALECHRPSPKKTPRLIGTELVIGGYPIQTVYAQIPTPHP